MVAARQRSQPRRTLRGGAYPDPWPTWPRRLWT